MQISMVNLTRTESDEKLARVIRAINRQIREDFEPYWKRGATLPSRGHRRNRETRARSQDVRGDAVIYLLGKPRRRARRLVAPYRSPTSRLSRGFVFTKIADRLGED